MSTGGRDVWASQRSGRWELTQLLHGIVVAELLSPSRDFWLVTPWVSNVGVLEDTHGRFRQVNPTGGRQLDLISFLNALLEAGTRVTVVTRTPAQPETAMFLRSLASACAGLPSAANLRLIGREDLHAKGLLGDEYAVSGSMNFTWRGMHQNEELVHFHRDPAKVAWLRERFADEFGDWPG